VSWATYQVAETGELHIVPWDEERDAIANEHRLTTVCHCQPRLIRDDDWMALPIVNHRDPCWPGSSDVPS
jgi:hypothetical protein